MAIHSKKRGPKTGNTQSEMLLTPECLLFIKAMMTYYLKYLCKRCSMFLHPPPPSDTEEKASFLSSQLVLLVISASHKCSTRGQ